MSLTSGGWAPGFTQDQQTQGQTPALQGLHAGAQHPQPDCHTVLASVRVSVCHSGIRPLCLPGAGDTITEFDLRSVNYEVKSPKCHELSLAAPPHDRISFNFRCEVEAQEWATVVLSSLRETHRVAPQHYSPPRPPMRSNLKKQQPCNEQDTCLELTRAIEAGDMQSASLCAATLARQHAALKIQPTPRDAEDNEIK
ncbi:hypothetical protein F7725_028533 [Dissostichus mawsoni]|uniref:Uncharacterized protein n=1 Tax=Dissostichus mawsoni TaxID=36200 RepID=A0A7J5XFY3_DISMA|nr:hypothetical protein F7725_028533 [Dissostichus mawsoni]